MNSPETPVFIQPESWSHDILEAELVSRTVECDEDGNVPGYRLMAEFQANPPFAKFGGLPWVQAVITARDDARFARRPGWSDYSAYAPIPEEPEHTSWLQRRRAKRAAKLGRHAAR